jgi:hypothetical protein
MYLELAVENCSSREVELRAAWRLMVGASFPEFAWTTNEREL